MQYPHVYLTERPGAGTFWRHRRYVVRVEILILDESKSPPHPMQPKDYAYAYAICVVGELGGQR